MVGDFRSVHIDAETEAADGILAKVGDGDVGCDVLTGLVEFLVYYVLQGLIVPKVAL